MRACCEDEPVGSATRNKSWYTRLVDSFTRRRIWYKRRALLFWPPMGFCFFATLGETEYEVLAFGLGGGVFLAGLFLRIWAQMHLQHRLRVRKTLTTTGPYGFVRNPIYIANTLMLTGCTAMSELMWMVPVVLVYCAVIHGLVVRYEEQSLSRKYGVVYEDYRKRVPRWFPRLGRVLPADDPRRWRLVFASMIAEVHNLLLPVAFILKEIIN